jgi:anti-sigma factor RsiW
MSDHVTIERLSDYLDGVLARNDATALERHVKTCAPCARDLSRLRALLAEARVLPREIDPPPAVWSSIRESLDARKVTALPRNRSAVARSHRSQWLVAASLILVATATVSLVVRRNPQRAPAVRSVTTFNRTGAVVATMIERHYLPALNQLTASLAAQGGAPRRALPTVDRSLVIVDAAIAETRAALDRDPGNREIADLLAANYQKKLDLLKRVSELASEQ